MTAPLPGHNEPPVQQSKGSSSGDSSANVRVVARVRPLAQYELDNGSNAVVTKVPNISSDGPETLQIHQAGDEQRWFELDAVLDQNCSQHEVYEKSGAYKAISEDLFSGFNCTILAYGQTGAGKTFTMGTAAKNVSCINETDGVIPRAVKDLFDNINAKCDNNAHVELSYMEVYNEEIRDLLNSAAVNGSNQLRIRETMTGEVYVRGLQARPVGNPAEIGKLMEEASSRRVVASTKMNAESSRSHAICVLRVKGVLEDSTKFQSKLTLVDLAGSERIKKTEAKGNRAQEGININKGLFVLGQVVSALAEQRPKFKRRPPFRDSKLTRLLQDSLGGNSRTIMIACCSPADFNLEETINTLRYATQARNIKNTATANVVRQISQEEAMKLERENQLLKQQVEELQEAIRKLTEDVTEEDIVMIQDEQRRSIQFTDGDSEVVSSLPVPGGTTPPIDKHHMPLTPEMEIPMSKNSGLSEDEDSEEGAAMGEGDDVPGPLGIPVHSYHSTGSKQSSKTTSLDARYGSELDLQHGAEDRTSFALDEELPNASAKSYQELVEENQLLRYKLRNTRMSMKASMTQSAIELPALKARVMMLEDELNESESLKTEAETIRQELVEAKADRDSAKLAARQLAAFMERQKLDTGFRGDELEKKRIRDFHKRLDEQLVEFFVTMLVSLKEQMRLLGDFFDMVVTVIESPDILNMLGHQGAKKRQGGDWWGGFGNKQIEEKTGTEDRELRHRLLGEHIKLFNSRLLDIEEEINNRSESVDTILAGLNNGREEMEGELPVEETEFVRDFFSAKGEKLLQEIQSLRETTKKFTQSTTTSDHRNALDTLRKEKEIAELEIEKVLERNRNQGTLLQRLEKRLNTVQLTSDAQIEKLTKLLMEEKKKNFFLTSKAGGSAPPHSSSRQLTALDLGNGDISVAGTPTDLPQSVLGVRQGNMNTSQTNYSSLKDLVQEETDLQLKALKKPDGERTNSERNLAEGVAEPGMDDFKHVVDGNMRTSMLSVSATPLLPSGTSQASFLEAAIKKQQHKTGFWDSLFGGGGETIDDDIALGVTPSRRISTTHILTSEVREMVLEQQRLEAEHEKVIKNRREKAKYHVREMKQGVFNMFLMKNGDTGTSAKHQDAPENSGVGGSIPRQVQRDTNGDPVSPVHFVDKNMGMSSRSLVTKDDVGDIDLNTLRQMAADRTKGISEDEINKVLTRRRSSALAAVENRHRISRMSFVSCDEDWDDEEDWDEEDEDV